MSVEDLGAELELPLGEEGEKRIITTPKMARIPKGLADGSRIFRDTC